MGVQQYEDLSKDVKKLFKLDTKNTSYVIAVVDDEQFLGHVYYGQKLNDYHLDHLLRIEEGPFVPSRNNRDRGSFLDSFPMEYPAHGLGDYREDCISIRTGEGNTGLSLNYVSHKIILGKPALEGLPASFGTEQECETLEITCRDSHTGLEAVLMYTVFEDVDVITRSVKVVNASEKTLFLTRVMSACLDMDNRDFEAVTLHGSWARERHIQTVPVSHAKLSVESVRGESSHQDHPFMALKTKGADDDHGEVYAMNFVYSGNFKAMVQNDQFDQLRMIMGIHPEDFSWKLNPGEAFQAPEVVMVYSAGGLGTMTRTFHDFYRNHLIRGEYKDKKRPILINNWEATYFEFNTEKLIAIAKQASELGIEMLVMDDGWFGKRNNDRAGLGDWFVNKDKFPNGLDELINGVNVLGMDFGIWIEPEMVNRDSDLYRSHPEWAYHYDTRVKSELRHQLVLNMTLPAVQDYVYNCIDELLSNNNIKYIKWDMNRPFSEAGAENLENPKMLWYLHTKAVYDIVDRLKEKHGDVQFEACASGGGRSDIGALSHFDECWTSDNTDAIDRLSIQKGYSMLKPTKAMRAWVTDIAGINKPCSLDFRFNVAMQGSLGLGGNLLKYTDEDKEVSKKNIALYKKIRNTVQFGNLYRVNDFDKDEVLVNVYVSNDKSNAVAFIAAAGTRFFKKRMNICFDGLDENSRYRFTLQGKEYEKSGSYMAQVGIPAHIRGAYYNEIIEIEKV